MRLVPLQEELTVTPAMAAMNQAGLFYDGCNTRGRFMPTDGDAWLLNGYILCTRPWPMELYALTVRILTVLRRPRAGWHLKLVAMIDDHRYLVLEEGVQSMFSTVKWLGKLPLESGFGVVMNDTLIATDRISVRALYGVKEHENLS